MSKIIPVELHNEIVSKAYQNRGYEVEESNLAAQWSAKASWYGIKTHHALKALHLEEVFGSKVGGCKPGAQIEKLPSRFPGFEKWNANLKLGQVVAGQAMNRATELAEQYGIGAVAVDNAFHYLWGGGYVIEAAKKGYIAYTCCTSTLAEVIPFGGKFPTLGTNPHSWAFPTQDSIGFPICVDWATSMIAMGRVQQCKREGMKIPPNSAVDKDGNITEDPHQVVGLLPFAGHKGYGLGLIDELYGAFIGGPIPTFRGLPKPENKNGKFSGVFYFQAVHPEALNCFQGADKDSQTENIKNVINDILGHGNDKCLLPGQLEAQAAKESEKQNGLIFTEAEYQEFQKIAVEVGVKGL